VGEVGLIDIPCADIVLAPLDPFHVCGAGLVGSDLKAGRQLVLSRSVGNRQPRSEFSEAVASFPVQFLARLPQQSFERGRKDQK
jgi:hypothetical protein